MRAKPFLTAFLPTSGAALVLLLAGIVLAPADDVRPILVDGKAIEVKGVTYGAKSKGAAIDDDMKVIAGLGANAIRTWGCGDETQNILDAAQRNGLKVMLGLWMRHGRAGAEGNDSFNYTTDEAGKAKQKESALNWVRKFQNHPALLCWGVGNEVILNMGPEDQKVAYSKFLEEVVAGVKEIDKTHPVGSVSAWTLDVPYWQKYTPSLDFYGINVYGNGAAGIPEALKKLDAPRPYLITEYGARGEWSVPTDANGVKSEPDDQEKYDAVAKGWGEMISKNWPLCLGGFVFNYGSGGIDHTSLWLSLRVDKAARPAYWGTLKAFTGKDPEVERIKIDAFLIRNADQAKKVGEWTPVMVKFTAPKREECKVTFAYNDRALGWPAKDGVQMLESRPVNEEKGLYEICVPKSKGPIKVYSLVRDDVNLAEATASMKAGTN